MNNPQRELEKIKLQLLDLFDECNEVDNRNKVSKILTIIDSTILNTELDD